MHFHYLQRSLWGKAAKQIKSFHFSAENYNVAWNSLDEQYNNTRVLVYNQIKALFNVEHIKEINRKNSQSYVWKHLCSIKSLTCIESFWETLVICLITSKLDFMSVRDWEQSISETNLPNLKEL